MKKNYLFLPVLGLMFLTSCSSNLIGGGSGGGQNNLKSENIFAYQAATSIGMIAQVDTPSVSPLGLQRAVSDDLVEKVKTYLPTIEAALTGNQLLTSVEEQASDREGYQYKIVVSYNDINLNLESFVMYYNETLVEEEYDHDDHELEQEFTMEGIIIIDGFEYQMHGEKELENDEYETNFYYQLDSNTIISVQQEIENTETEFEYKIIQNGRTVLEYSIEVENNEVELETKDTTGKYELKFEIEKRNGVQYIKAKIEQNHQEDVIYFEKVVDATTGVVTYQVVTF